MRSFLSDMRATIMPEPRGKYGPLPLLMVAMTVVTGLVDAFSYLVLGHVFVANMTGNVVFLGFALAGAPGLSITASLAALLAFAFGALIGGRLGARLSHHRGRLLTSSATVQAVLLAGSAVLAALSPSSVPNGYKYSLIVALAVAMGVQNAASRKLAIPDLTTTVLTLTITGIAADSTLAGGKGSLAGRRLVAVAAMLLGAFIGAAFVVHHHTVFPLAIAAVVIGVIAATTAVLGRNDPTWVHIEPAGK